MHQEEAPVEAYAGRQHVGDRSAQASEVIVRISVASEPSG